MTTTEATEVRDRDNGLLLVAGAALAWSFGGAIARWIEVGDVWAVVFWRSVFAAAFLLGFMILRDGFRGALALIGAMRWPALGVAACFAVASTAFVVALAYTTVANILLMTAAAPLIAALLGRVLFAEAVSRGAWIAIGAVLVGMAVMVSDSLDAAVSPVGDGLALMIALAFACATIITRRHAHVRMTPAVMTGVLIAAGGAAIMAGDLAVGAADMGRLAVFGGLNLGFGLALFVTGARLAPAPLTVLVCMLEPVLGPLWVWLTHDETPSGRTLAGGAVILAALVVHVAREGRLRG